VIEHVALWTDDLERICAFYQTYLNAGVGPRYTNPRTGFASHFLTFASGARLEVMRHPDLQAAASGERPARTGFAHLAFALGAKTEVDALTARLERDGYRVVSGPRTTGDGYYESCVLDPDGNRVELTT
jgi:lactoylglutathione lyase